MAEFTTLVSQLHQSPNDHAIKAALVKSLPEMLVLAKENHPMALYHVAHIYPQNSPQYKQTMRQSANLGCTNAMLEMCQILAKKNDVNELNVASHYLGMINESNDSYIKEQAQKLIAEYPELAKLMNEHDKPKLYPHSNIHQFFIRQSENQGNNEYLEEDIMCNI